jgi:hypothetical protein
VRQVVLTLVISLWATALFSDVPAGELSESKSTIKTTDDGITFDRSYLFKHESRNQIEWDKLDPGQWLSFPLWNKRRLELQKTPLWRLKLRAKKHREIVGYLLSCIGRCTNYQGEGETFYHIGHRSRLWERDEVVTGENSYAWIFLLDGTMVRMGPKSSISLVELNIGRQENFIYARVNRGVVLWLSRETTQVDQPLIRESDSLFLPLPLLEANTFTWDIKQLQQSFRSDISLKWLPDDLQILEQGKRNRLNKMIVGNNQIFGGKRTRTLLALPNGTLVGNLLRTEMVVLEMGDSYIKNRTVTWLNRKSKLASASPVLNLFGSDGSDDQKKFNLTDGQWYRLSARGERIAPLDNIDPMITMLARMELVTSRFPSVLLAREIWLQRRSAHLFSKISAKELAINFGYQLWESKNITANGLDIGKRERFLTKDLALTAQRRYKLWDRLLQEIELEGNKEKVVATFGPEYYLRAFKHYTANHTPFFLPRDGAAGSNSFRSKFWLRYYVDRKR